MGTLSNLCDLVDEEVLQFIPKQFAEEQCVFPICKKSGKLLVAVPDLDDFYTIKKLKHICNYEVETILVDKQEILNAIDEFYCLRMYLKNTLHSIEENQQKTDVTQLLNNTPMIDFVNAMLKKALHERASDIHIEPTSQALRIRFRIDGVLYEKFSMPIKIHLALISRLKIMSELDIAEKRLPQDGRMEHKIEDAEIDFRISTMPTILGEKMVIRILNRNRRLLSINFLGFSSGDLEIYKNLCKKPYGLILICGPTGSGKSGTLYASLEMLNDIGKNIITLEDPVEYMLDGVNQIQVNSKTNLTFARGLRSVLRQDPDIIMVGEIRDNETAEISVRAAMTGHLVFATLHTNDSIGAISRLFDMGVEPFMIAGSILGIVAQRLVRKICPRCKVEYTVEEDTLQSQFMKKYSLKQLKLYHGKGCSYCNYTGYYERTAIYEILKIDKNLRDLVKNASANENLKKACIDMRFHSMYKDGIEKILSGITTFEEVMEVVHDDR